MTTTGKPIELLLVEDSYEDVFFFKRALGKTGVAVNLRIAADGRQAVDMLAKTENSRLPDVVFLDLKLPLLGGFDVLRWVAEQNFSPPLQIIVLSGSPHEKDRALATELGAIEYLVKPVSAEILRARLLNFARAE